MIIRERMPLRLFGEVFSTGGYHGRWSGDSRNPSDLPNGVTFGTTMPGGFSDGSAVLPRDMRRHFSDLDEFVTVRFKGVGGDIAWEGRLQATPRQSGDQSSVTAEMVGWQAHLDDNPSAREIYLDPNFSNWTAISTTLKASDYLAGADCDDVSTTLDPGTGLPALVTGFTGAWSRVHECKGMYDTKGIGVGTLYFCWMRPTSGGTPVPAINPADTNWTWRPYFAHDDVQSGAEFAPAQRAAGPVVSSYTPTDPLHKFIYVYLAYQLAAAGGGEGVNYGINWTYLGVVGRSGIPVYGTLGQSGGIGVLASDVVANAIRRWAPLLKFTTGATGTIPPTGYFVPTAAYLEPTTVSEIIKDVTKYDLVDWAVWENQTFYMNGWGLRGRSWVSRVREAQLQETGPQVDRIYNGVIVTYTDDAGISRSVGPPNSGTQYTDLSLYDSDPTNPATAAGIVRYSPPVSVNTSELAGAIAVGARYLSELKASNTAGQASLVGYAEDALTGTQWPSWMVRAGDWISFLDASDTSERRIVSTSYDDATKTNAIQLDSPPDDIQALLERMNANLINVAA